MTQRITQKLEELEQILEELEQILPDSLEEYRDTKTRAACERYAEKIVECITDTAMVLLVTKKKPTPKQPADAFSLLEKNGVIPTDLCEQLRRARRMRNLIVHQYGDIDDGIVHDALKHHLQADAKAFIEHVHNTTKTS